MPGEIPVPDTSMPSEKVPVTVPPIDREVPPDIVLDVEEAAALLVDIAVCAPVNPVPTTFIPATIPIVEDTLIVDPELP